MIRTVSRMLALVGSALALAALLSGCIAPGEREQYAIAGGGTTGVYYGFGEQLAGVLTERLDADVQIDETNGSVDNLQRVSEGRALVGFAQSDAAADAVAGRGAFSEPLAIEAIARLYDEYVHVVVRADSDIAEIGDLQGRSVSLGAAGSGVNLVASRVLQAADVDPGRVADRELGLAESIGAFRAGQIEAFFWVGGLPTPGLEQLFAESTARLLSIDPATVETVNAAHGGVYRLAEFPIGAYGLAEATATMTIPNYLVVASGTPDDLVAEILDELFAKRSEIARSVPVAALLDRRQAIFTDPVDLHPGAIEYYRAARR